MFADYRSSVLHGKGRFKYANGNLYEGQFVEGKRSGKGKYVFADGTLYEGDFANNMFEGWGKYTDPNGTIYEGSFRGNKLNGTAVFINNVGDKFSGEWKDDMKHGQGRYVYASGGMRCTALQSAFCFIYVCCCRYLRRQLPEQPDVWAREVYGFRRVVLRGLVGGWQDARQGCVHGPQGEEVRGNLGERSEAVEIRNGACSSPLSGFLLFLSTFCVFVK